MSRDMWRLSFASIPRECYKCFTVPGVQNHSSLLKSIQMLLILKIKKAPATKCTAWILLLYWIAINMAGDGAGREAWLPIAANVTASEVLKCSFCLLPHTCTCHPIFVFCMLIWERIWFDTTAQLEEPAVQNINIWSYFININFRPAFQRG